MSGYVLGRDAEQDLDDLWGYIAADSVDAADRPTMRLRSRLLERIVEGVARNLLRSLRVGERIGEAGWKRWSGSRRVSLSLFLWRRRRTEGASHRLGVGGVNQHFRNFIS